MAFMPSSGVDVASVPLSQLLLLLQPLDDPRYLPPNLWVIFQREEGGFQFWR